MVLGAMVSCVLFSYSLRNVFCCVVLVNVRTTMSAFDAASFKSSVFSKSPLRTFTFGYFSEKDGFGSRSSTVMLYSGCAVTSVLKTVPPTYPVTPVLFHKSVGLCIKH